MDQWYVFPCKKGSKEPNCYWRDQSRPGYTIEGHNVGLDCGKTGLIVLDLDCKSDVDGIKAYKELKQELGFDDSDTFVVKTPSGGRHIYFKLPPGVEIGNSRRGLPPGIDVRGVGGYVILPPSKIGGKRYEWIKEPNGEGPQELPKELLEILMPPSVEIVETEEAITDRYAEAALQSEIEDLRAAPFGERNNRLNQAAFSLGQLMGAGSLPGWLIKKELLEACQSIGLPESEAVPTIKSGLLAGVQEPRTSKKPLRVTVDGKKITFTSDDEEEDIPQTPEWKIYTMEDAFKPRPPLEYIVEDLFSLPSLSIVYAPPGAFKTLLLTDMAACVSVGKPWLKSKQHDTSRKTKQAGVLWCDFDNGTRRMHERLEAIGRAHGLTKDAPIKYVSMEIFDASKYVQVMQLTNLITELGVKVVILDNLRNISGSVEENSAEMGSVMFNLRRLVEETRCACIVIHHQRKSTSQGGRTGDTLRGHSSIEAAVDLALLVERDGMSEQVTIRSTKTRDVDVHPFGARFVYSHKGDSSELEAAGFVGVVSEDTSSNSAIRKSIIDTVTQYRGLNKTELTNKVKKLLPEAGINRIRKQIAMLVNDGYLSTKDGPSNSILYYPPTAELVELEKGWRIRL